MKCFFVCLYLLLPFNSNGQIDDINKLFAELKAQLASQKSIAINLYAEKNELLSNIQNNKKVNKKTQSDLKEKNISLYNLKGTLKKMQNDKETLYNKIELLRKENAEKRRLLESSNSLNEGIISELNTAKENVKNLENELEKRNQKQIVKDAKIEYQQQYKNSKNYDDEVIKDVDRWEPTATENPQPIKFTAILNAGFIGTDNFGYAYNLYSGIIYKNNLFIGLGIGQEDYPNTREFSTTLVNLNIRASFSKYGIAYNDELSFFNNVYFNAEFGTAFLKDKSLYISSNTGTNLNVGFGMFYFFTENVSFDANVGYKLQKYSVTNGSGNIDGLCLRIGIIYKP
jgi:hypothetical protein